MAWTRFIVPGTLAAAVVGLCGSAVATANERAERQAHSDILNAGRWAIEAAIADNIGGAVDHDQEAAPWRGKFRITLKQDMETYIRNLPASDRDALARSMARYDAAGKPAMTVVDLEQKPALKAIEDKNLAPVLDAAYQQARQASRFGKNMPAQIDDREARIREDGYMGGSDKVLHLVLEEALKPQLAKYRRLEADLEAQPINVTCHVTRGDVKNGGMALLQDCRA